jgi:homoserine acetyltransferase
MLRNIVCWVYTPEFFITNLKTTDAYREWQEVWNHVFRLYSVDARDWYYSMQAWAEFNLGDSLGFNGDAKAALESIQAKVLIIGNKGDMLFNREECIFAKNAISEASYVEIDTPWGHMSCVGWDPEGTEIMRREITKFLSDLTPGGQ